MNLILLIILISICIAIFIYLSIKDISEEINETKLEIENDFLGIYNLYGFPKTLVLCPNCKETNVHYGPFYVTKKGYFEKEIYYYYCSSCGHFTNNPIVIVARYENETGKTYLLYINKYKLLKETVVEDFDDLINKIMDFLSNGEVIE